jgi:Chondroitinase B
MFGEAKGMAFLYVNKNLTNSCHRAKPSHQIAIGFLLFCTLLISASSTPAEALDFNPLCHSEAGGKIRNVSSCALLDAALSNAMPGDIIVLADGNYNCNRIAARNGSTGNPIIIRAANPRQARLNNATLTLSGNYNVVANLTFNNSGVKVTGNYNRITGNKFQNNAGPLAAAATVALGNSNRIDHNEVVDYGAGHRGFQIVPASTGNNTAKNNVIDRNYLHRSLGPSQNGAEGIQLGTYGAHTYQELDTIVEYNLLERWEIDGEMLSNKSTNNIFRFNTLADSNAIGPIRHGSHIDVISNYFVNVRGLINYADDNKIIGNVIENGDLVVRNGDITQSMVPQGSEGHPASLRTLVAANRVINGEICVGCRIPGGDSASGVPAKFTDLKGNQGTVTLLDQQNTTQTSTYGGVVVPAVRLRSTDVGPGSPDVCGGMFSSGTKLPSAPSDLRLGSGGILQ